MELMAILAAVPAVMQVAGAVALTGFAVYKAVKAKRYESAIEILVGATQTVPPGVQPKDWVQSVAIREGLEDTVVNPAVRAAKAKLRESGKMESLEQYAVDQARYLAGQARKQMKG